MVEGVLSGLFLLHKQPNEHDNSITHEIATGIAVLTARDFPAYFATGISQACNPELFVPPQSFWFPMTENTLVFLKIPSHGSSPSKLLKDEV